MAIDPTLEYGSMNVNSVVQEGVTTLSAKTTPWLLESHLESIMLASVILEAMAGGIIFIFSNTIMRTFAKFDADIGINVMNELNILIVNPLFVFVFFGGLISAYPATVMMMKPDQFSKPARYYALASTLVFFFGEFLVTVTQNVPRNNALLAVDPDSEEGIRYWETDFLGGWVAWNTARCVFSVIAAILGGLSLVSMRNT
mmetsp:Transcript_45533/g.67113  ORF Transcript_45533/g.67113 Transcript_45533/m.67113 type:complete len:200 (-) Transcript_45533:101-700(-)|eukprot:CAMPEP_0195517112 /NCGR_PEP_ID=MMETSP0794_2-20130614/9803_1 /TAXON_ID=515487 /ORGANISM="Stephanopyxis turris, Strain CCMP 815" /LENGTH=199 /DNA_ID=CAMNT_0040645867 /DNA_START=53 /DNA_END=652 /DNA_ORIENTATION=+